MICETSGSFDILKPLILEDGSKKVTLSPEDAQNVSKPYAMIKTIEAHQFFDKRKSIIFIKH
jgi:hypothetical protein